MVTATKWEKITLGNIADFQGGSQPPLFTFSRRNIPGYIRLIQIRDYKTNKYCTYVPASLAKRFCSADDIMIGRYGPPIFQILRGLEGAYNVALIKTIPKNIDKDFLYFTLKREDLFKYIETLSRRTSGQTGIDLSNLREFELSIPTSRREQSAIAAALSDADSLITSLQKLIAKKKAIKQGAMQELLTGKRRLPGFDEKWNSKQLDDICEVINGGTPSTSVADYWGGNILWCTPTDITGCESKYIWKTAATITRKGQLAHSLTILPPGTILLCSRATIGDVRIAKLPITTNQGFKSLIAGKQTNNEWLYYIISTLKKKFLEKAIGSTFLEISKNSLSCIPIRTPTLNEQTAIAKILSDMDTDIEQLEKKLSKYQQIKQGMMQELLTGRIRLIDADAKQKRSAPAKKHNQKFDDAVMIAGIVDAFYSETYPLGRKKVQKLLYLMRRKEKADVSAFHKKAAGPYADSVRYNGGEPIAQGNHYITEQKSSKGSMFRRGANIEQALGYIQSWGKQASIDWLISNFQRTRVDDLELFATVDMAICDLRKMHKPVSVQTIKELIQSTKEWRDKLDKTYFSDPDIERAIDKCREFFGKQ